MSLTEIKLWDVVYKQYRYKFKAYFGAFSSLVMAQIIAMVFSFAGVASSGSGSDWYSLTIQYFSADTIIAFSIVWAFVISITITTRAYRYDDFTFITNRLTSNIANISFLATASFIGGLLAMLTGSLLKVIVFYSSGVAQIAGNDLSFQSFLIGFIGTSLYLLLISSLGYFFGVLAQLSKLFVILIPALFLGHIFLLGTVTWIADVFQFYFAESSFFLFFCKVVITALIFFSIATILSNRLEVRA